MSADDAWADGKTLNDYYCGYIQGSVTMEEAFVATCRKAWDVHDPAKQKIHQLAFNHLVLPYLDAAKREGRDLTQLESDIIDDNLCK